MRLSLFANVKLVPAALRINVLCTSHARQFWLQPPLNRRFGA
jgi:hypothetical protein